MSDPNNNPNNNNNDPNKSGGGFNLKNNRFAIIMVLVIIGIIAMQYIIPMNSAENELLYSEFLTDLEAGRISNVTIIDRIKVESVNVNGRTYVTRLPFAADSTFSQLLHDAGVNFSAEQTPVDLFTILIQFLPWIVVVLFVWFMLRQAQGTGNRAFSFGKSKAKLYNENAKKVTYKDVAGQKEAKYELQEVVEFLKNPSKFTKMGAKIPKGVLLVGSPGTGKTLLAKATAGEAGVSFFHMSGSDFVEMFVGVGASRVRDLFEQGRKNAPCILFIDELDAVGRTRGAGYGGGHDEREQTLNQMLVEMDGFDTKDGVIILAATNRPDVLDPALLRPGRFDRQVVVAMPDIKEREAILGIHAKNVPLNGSIDLNLIARATPGFSGADLANLVNEAALYAARRSSDYVEREDFEEARDKIYMGVARKSRVTTEEELTATAYHEAGHALLHYYLDKADPLHKVTIVPRGQALGVAFSLPENDNQNRTKSWFEDRIVISYGGYVAEKLIYKETSAGTQNDLKQATGMARRMVTEWGMSSLGPISLSQEDEPIFLGKEIARHKDYSEQTAKAVDAEINKILDNGMKRAEKILTENKDKLEILAKALLKEETMTDEQVRETLGFPPAKVVNSESSKTATEDTDTNSKAS